jgi:phospholipid/cholesterol/gamma-HCH transport system permease protein
MSSFGTLDSDQHEESIGPAGAPDAEEVRSSPLHRFLEEGRDLAVFAGNVVGDVPSALRLYPAEIFHHAGRLIRSNTAVLLFVSLVSGLGLGLTVHYLLSSVGAESYIAATATLGGLRGFTEVAFAWTFAAKAGCGIVAELGSMKISDEIGAMEVMGVRSICYLASTRFLATVLVVPFLWILTLSANFVGSYIMNVQIMNTASEGAWKYYLFLFQNPYDFTGALVWAIVEILVVVLVTCYYGFRASGGPVGVGLNTARAMMLNMALLSVIAIAAVQMLWGNNPNAPIGN